MGVATTTDSTDSVRTSFEMLKNLYGMPVQVVETIKKENEEKSAILIKLIKSAPKSILLIIESPSRSFWVLSVCHTVIA